MATKIREVATKVHQMAQKGFGIGTNELYDRARPSFPHTAIDKLWEAMPARSAPLNVVEMGCGTGLFTRAFLSHPKFASATGSLLATDPSEGMRTVFTQRTTDPRVQCEEGTFDSVPAPDHSADLVIAAQAWHWCPDHDKALTEIVRVLRPDGVFALIWNMEDREAAQWVADLRDVYERYEQGTPQFRLMLWRATFECATYKRFFQPPEETRVTHIVPTTAEGVVNRVFSKSYMTTLEGEEKVKSLKACEAIADRKDDKVWIDKDEGIFKYPYETYLVVCKRK